MEKEFTLKSELVRDDVDRQMVYLVRRFTDLSDEDMGILLEMAHSLPFVGNLESGDTYINVLTRNGESMVVAQYRHPDCDLYKRSIIGNIEKKEDEPAVYRALEKGISGRGLIGIIEAYKACCRNLHEMAEHLDVPDDYLADVIDCYRSKYGQYVAVDNYMIYFIPQLAVMKINNL